MKTQAPYPQDSRTGSQRVVPPAPRGLDWRGRRTGRGSGRRRGDRSPSAEEKLVEEGLLFGVRGAGGEVGCEVIDIRTDRRTDAQPVKIAIAEVNAAIDPREARVGRGLRERVPFEEVCLGWQRGIEGAGARSDGDLGIEAIRAGEGGKHRR